MILALPINFSILASNLTLTAPKIQEPTTTLRPVDVNATLFVTAPPSCKCGTDILPANVYAKNRQNVTRINTGMILLAAANARKKLCVLTLCICKILPLVIVPVLWKNAWILSNTNTQSHANAFAGWKSVLLVTSKVQTVVNVLNLNVFLLLLHAHSLKYSILRPAVANQLDHLSLRIHMFR